MAGRLQSIILSWSNMLNYNWWLPNLSKLYSLIRFKICCSKLNTIFGKAKKCSNGSFEQTSPQREYIEKGRPEEGHRYHDWELSPKQAYIHYRRNRQPFVQACMVVAETPVHVLTEQTSSNQDNLKRLLSF